MTQPHQEEEEVQFSTGIWAEAGPETPGLKLVYWSRGLKRAPQQKWNKVGVWGAEAEKGGSKQVRGSVPSKLCFKNVLKGHQDK